MDSNRSTMRRTSTPSTRTARMTSKKIPSSTTSGMPGGDAQRHEEDRVLHCQQRQNLRDRLLAGHHQKEANHQGRQPDAEDMMCDAHRALGKPGADAVSHHRQAEAREQRGRDVEKRFDLSVDADPIDDSHQKQGDHESLQHGRHRGHHEEMGTSIADRHHDGHGRQQERLRAKQPDRGEERFLADHQVRGDQHAGGAQDHDVGRHRHFLTEIGSPAPGTPGPARRRPARARGTAAAWRSCFRPA